MISSLMELAQGLYRSFSAFCIPYLVLHSNDPEMLLSDKQHIHCPGIFSLCSGCSIAA